MDVKYMDESCHTYECHPYDSHTMRERESHTHTNLHTHTHTPTHPHTHTYLRGRTGASELLNTIRNGANVKRFSRYFQHLLPYFGVPMHLKHVMCDTRKKRQRVMKYMKCMHTGRAQVCFSELVQVLNPLFGGASAPEIYEIHKIYDRTS